MYRLKPFGVLNGREMPVIELFSDKCAVELLPYGAAVRAIRVPDRTDKLTDICLGYDDLESYRSLDACFGGRNCGNLPARKTRSPSPTPLPTVRRVFPVLYGWRSPIA